MPIINYVTIDFSLPVGEQLRRIRKEYKVSVAKLAKRLGCNRTNIDYLESPKNSDKVGSFKFILSYLQALGIQEVRISLNDNSSCPVYRNWPGKSKKQRQAGDI